MAEVYFHSEHKKSQKKGLQVWRIYNLIAKGGTLVTSHLLFIHALSGCDTITDTFGQGKTNQKIQASEEV